jgi:flavin reductase (DIM6/NTAB) family NADH-FMN oxidoreductase RutF
MSKVVPKVVKKAFVALRPVPVVLVSCGHGEQANIITIAWTGILCSDPPQVGIGVRPSRHSHELIQEMGEFVVNIPGEGLLDKVDYCGFVSGRETDKFAAQGLTPVPGSAVQTPIIAECPINIECRLAHTLSLGSHDLFIGQVVAVQISQEALDEQGRIDNDKLKPILFTGDEYWGLGSWLGRYGFSQK